jgi:hypothetical protein
MSFKDEKVLNLYMHYLGNRDVVLIPHMDDTEDGQNLIG